jgi:hypothetical protein
MPHRLCPRRRQLLRRRHAGELRRVLVGSHWAAQDIGFALAISTVASLCSQIPAGALIDAIPDKRRPVRIGLLGIGAAG